MRLLQWIYEKSEKMCKLFAFFFFIAARASELIRSHKLDFEFSPPEAQRAYVRIHLRKGKTRKKHDDDEHIITFHRICRKTVPASKIPLDDFYRIHISPYKGELELWYQKKISFYTDSIIIFLTLWVVLFPDSDLVFKVYN